MVKHTLKILRGSHRKILKYVWSFFKVMHQRFNIKCNPIWISIQWFQQAYFKYKIYMSSLRQMYNVHARINFTFKETFWNQLVRITPRDHQANLIHTITPISELLPEKSLTWCEIRSHGVLKHSLNHGHLCFSYVTPQKRAKRSKK